MIEVSSSIGTAPAKATHLAVFKTKENHQFWCYFKDNCFWTLIADNDKRELFKNNSFTSLDSEAFDFYEITSLMTDNLKALTAPHAFSTKCLTASISFKCRTTKELLEQLDEIRTLIKNGVLPGEIKSENLPFSVLSNNEVGMFKVTDFEGNQHYASANELKAMCAAYNLAANEKLIPAQLMDEPENPEHELRQQIMLFAY